MGPVCCAETVAWAGLLAAFLALACRPAGGADDNAQPGLTAVETVCVDDQATAYGTFQSHNQKVVSNRNGIFMTHIRTRNEPYTAQQWRLSWSTDGGTTFQRLYEATHATSAPAMETDEEANLYLARPDFVDGNAYLHRFLAADRYANPLVSTIPGGSAGKYCMHYDPERQQLYYFAHNNTFHTIGLDGRVRSSCALLAAGESAVLQYPLLSLDRDGTLHAAWTTQKHGVYLYWDIHHMLSRDGGATWQKLDGTPLTLPVVADQHGPADRVTLDDEYDVHTWLSSVLARDGKLHFLYQAQSHPPREHYVRYDVATAKRELDISPELKGQRVSLLGLDGFFAARSSLAGSTLYCVCNWQGRIGCLASDDNGTTWYDYAASEQTFTPYAIGGCRELTADDHVIGSFTDQAVTPPRVYFIRIPAGLSSARVAGATYADGRATLTFADARGHPSEVRARATDGPWSPWQPFAERVAFATPSRPTQFQLRSRLGVVAPPRDVAVP